MDVVPVGGKAKPRYTIDPSTPLASELDREAFSPCIDPALQPACAYARDEHTAAATPSVASCYCTRIVHTSVNSKHKNKVHVLSWSPTKPRVISGSEGGQLTCWSSATFTWDTFVQGHASAIRAMQWDHAGDFMLTGDRNGHVRYWPNSLRIQDEFKAHDDAVRGISFSPSDSRFCTGSDDGTIRVWDAWEQRTERKLDSELRGHGGQVNACMWHPHMGLIASGSRDTLCMLWDPKAGKRVHTVRDHKNEVQALAWSPCNPNWLVTASRDQSLRFVDLRTLAAFQVAVAEHKGVTAVAWHPFQERLLAVGHHDGCLQYWAVGLDYPQAEVPHAHDSTISDVAWAPAGNLAATSSSDFSVKFWARSRPGDTAEQYAYQGNPMRNYPEVNSNVVPVPDAASALKAGGGGAYAGGLAARSFGEQQDADGAGAAGSAFFGDEGLQGSSSIPPLSDRRRVLPPSGGGSGSMPLDYVPKTTPGPTYVCKLCGARGVHWFQMCPTGRGEAMEHVSAPFSYGAGAPAGWR